VRRTTGTLLLGLLAVLLFAWGPATAAHACSCAESAPAQHFADADAVFTGRLLQRSVDHPDRPTASSSDPARHVFEVEVVLKGTAHTRQAVFSAASGASCGLELDGEGPFVVFARQDGDRYRADLCGGTTALTPHLHSELAALSGSDPGRILPGASPGTSWWTTSRLLGGGVLGLAGVGGALLLVRRRARRHPARDRYGVPQGSH
jgi:Tissue inhibitor of metalloproteinase